MGGNGSAPVIIKRKKTVASDAHHGGAWKVAYADFVTAMMAFFLLMWLLNATTEKQRKGLADHFSPTIPVIRASGGGDGALGGDSIFAEETLARSGVGASSPDPHAHEDDGSAAGDRQGLLALAESLRDPGRAAALTEQDMQNIAIRMSDEGLVIEVFSRPGAELFSDPGDRPTARLDRIIDGVAEVLDLVTNPVAITGHVRSQPIVMAQNPVWDRSIARASDARSGLAAHMDERRIRRVAGQADREPAAADPMALRNDRIELVVLLSDASEDD
jgi:chemotaxis protein MotB